MRPCSPARLVLLLALVPAVLAEPTDGDSRAPTLRADLSPEVRASLAEMAREAGAASGYGLLGRILRTGAYDFDAGALFVQTDHRWYSTYPEAGKRAALLELRRWPGDTVLGLFPIAPGETDSPPPVPDAVFEEPIDVGQGTRAWYGDWRSIGGNRPVIWMERRPAETGPVLGGLLIPGDAGFGPEAIPGLISELQAVFVRAQVRETVWARFEGHPRDRTIVMPRVGDAPGERGENTDPWQVATATDFTMGLPPGVRSRRTDASVPPPIALEGGRLWLRGRYTDSEGTEVAIGDGIRAGYVARKDSPDEAWQAGTTPPVGAPGAKREAAIDYDSLKEQTGALFGRAERWTELGFEGDWIVFRMTMETEGWEIGLPVLTGRGSPSLYWIPATWRGVGQSPAPPPIDPAERFGIRFEQLSASARRDQPWTEGFLTIPGMRVALPRDWWPSAALRSRDGFPIRIVRRGEKDIGFVVPVPPERCRPEALAADGWQKQRKPGAHRASAWYRNDQGDALFVGRDGQAFVFQADDLGGDRAEWWERMLDSVQMRKPEPPER